MASALADAPDRPATAGPGPRPVVDRWAVDLGAWLVAMSGPVAMWQRGQQVQVHVAAVLAAGACLVLARRPRTAWPGRLAIAAVTGALMVPVSGVVVGTWLLVGLVFADLVVRRVPAPRLGPLPTGATAPLLLLLVPTWLIPNQHYRSTAFTLSAAIAAVAIIGVAAPRRRRIGAIGAVVAAYGGAAVLATPRFVATSSLLLEVVGIGVVLIVAAIGEGERRWSASENLGPLAWALPAMAWMMANIGIWAGGLHQDRFWRYRAWRAEISVLPPRVLDALAATGIPLVALGLLAIGAGLATDPSATGRRLALGVPIVLLGAAAIGGLWEFEIVGR